MTPFGQLLHALLTANKVSVTTFAKRVHCHRSMIGNVMRGARKPPEETAMGKWADALGLAGAKRNEFIIAALLERTPDLVRRGFQEMQEQLRRRR